VRICIGLLLFVSSLAAGRSSAQDANSIAPQEVTFRSGELTLHGFLLKPQGEGPFPAVVWNHGSEAKPGTGARLGPHFNLYGYVLFVPHRRGHGASADQARWIGDLLDEELKRNGEEARARLMVSLLEEQLQDQLAAFDYLRTLPFVDPTRLATFGCSFGGIQTMLAAEKGAGLRAAVNFAGAAMNWERSAVVRERMVKAAQSARIPVYLIQAENDFSLGPTRVLSEVMTEHGKPHRAQIFPAFGTTNQEGHGFCGQGSTIWAGPVFSFLREQFWPDLPSVN